MGAVGRAGAAAVHRSRVARPCQGSLFGVDPASEPVLDLARELEGFVAFGRPSASSTTVSRDGSQRVETLTNEFWTARQRAAHSLHEVSYRACFKPQLPRFFTDRLTRRGERVYDPFMGRGTTPLEAALCGRSPLGCDVNPLSRMLVEPRLDPPASLDAIDARLSTIDWRGCADAPRDLLAFYHPDTLQEIAALRRYLLDRENAGSLDAVDRWIRMVAVNRLTGHSSGFFSVYTMPPNQAVSIAAQEKINARRGQVPPRRDVASLILRKSRSLLSGCDATTRAELADAARAPVLLTRSADDTPEIEDDSVQLVVTSPPFLDVVQYRDDNWLRCWFGGIDAQSVPVTMARDVDQWQREMTRTFAELYRVLAPCGHVAFEVGEVRGGRVRLEECVLDCGRDVGLEPLVVMINEQRFTKTSNCWGIANNRKGTNTNRIAVFRK